MRNVVAKQVAAKFTAYCLFVLVESSLKLSISLKQRSHDTREDDSRTHAVDDALAAEGVDHRCRITDECDPFANKPRQSSAMR